MSAVDPAKTLEERLEKVNTAKAEIARIMDDPRAWQNDCETVFSKFRLACVHTRKDTEAMDAVEHKEVIWRFLCKLCKTRPFLAARCDEVLKILLMSDSWKKELIDDPQCNIDDLPAVVRDELGERAASGPTMNMVVQRCRSARLLVDSTAGTWREIGYGLHVAITFLAGGSAARSSAAARALLTAPLSAGEGSGGKAESIVSLCRRGEAQGLLFVAQVSLGAQLCEASGAWGITYRGLAPEVEGESLFASFVAETVRLAEELIMAAPRPGAACLPVIGSGGFGAQQAWEIRSEGFMHSFVL